MQRVTAPLGDKRVGRGDAREEGGGGEEGERRISPQVVLASISEMLGFFWSLVWLAFFGEGEEKRDPTLMAWHRMALRRITGWGQGLGYTGRGKPAAAVIHSGLMN